MNTITAILNFLSSNGGKVLLKIISYVSSILKCLSDISNNKKKEKEAKEQKQFEKEVDKVIDKGNLEDLLNLKR